MMHSFQSRVSGSSNNSKELQAVFVRRVHLLVQLGYQRLNPSKHDCDEEPAITGLLVEAIDAVLDNRAHAWMRYFSVHDDPPVNNGKRKGKQRKRVDIRIDSSHFRPRVRYQFEAKRLGVHHSAANFLGVEGLGCFLRGDYSRNEVEAGMLGYVQSGDMKLWGVKIGDELTNAPTKYNVDPASPFTIHTIPSSPSMKTFQSLHHRPTIGIGIRIMHILLRFY